MNANRYRPTATAALILSADPLGGALMGAAAELAGLRALFLRPDEPARDALRTERPAAVLVDSDGPFASDEAFLGPAIMTGARIFLYGREPRIRELQRLIERYRLEAIVLPRDLDALTEGLASTGMLRLGQRK